MSMMTVYTEFVRKWAFLRKGIGIIIIKQTEFPEVIRGKSTPSRHTFIVLSVLQNTVRGTQKQSH
ncbi:hypothetical protein SPFM12_00297 [Salmonella phage SPFM12]|nr:hypothetical protein SPFM12_00297 [Salmonella phage SPFM12]